jgi:hypothetical protein
MPSVSLGGLRNIRELKALIGATEPIELRDRDTVIGQIIPESAWPAFIARKRAFCLPRDFVVGREIGSIQRWQSRLGLPFQGPH